MKLRKINPHRIKVPEVRVTAQFDEELYQQFKSSIAEAGIITPPICYEVEGELILCDGLHRLQEAIAAKEPTVDVVVIPGDMVDVLTKNLFLDHMRGKTPISQMVEVIKVLWKEYDLDSEKIAARTGMTRDYVEKLQMISELTPACLEALDEGRIGVGHAFALTKIKDPIRQEVVLHQQELYRWKVNELVEYIKGLLQLVKEKEEAQPREEERPPVKVKCTYCGEEYDPSEIAAPMTCRYCSGIMFASIAQARAEQTKEEAQHGEQPEAPK